MTSRSSAAIRCSTSVAGDSEWIARGPDTPAGQRVRISGNDGAILLVEPIALIAEARTPETDETPAEG